MKLQLFILIFFIVHSASPLHGQGDADTGAREFYTHCQSCHGIHKEKLGPMLASITNKKSRAWLTSFIINSQELIAAGDPYAVGLFLRYDHVVMPSFREFSQKQVDNILSFLEKESNRQEGLPTITSSADRWVYAGKEQYDKFCSNCHLIGAEMFGPSLGSISKRRPFPWLLDFITDSQKVIDEGDDYAVHLDQAYPGKKMPAFDFLTEDQIRLILNYIDYASSSPVNIAGSNARSDVPSQDYFRITRNSRERGTVKGDASGNQDDDGSHNVNKLFMIVFGLGSFVIQGWIIFRLYNYLSR